MIKFTLQHNTLHFKQPAGTSRGTYHKRPILLLHACDEDTNTEGIGECSPLPDLGCDRIDNYDLILRSFCKEISSTNHIPYETLRPYPSMLFGIETALLHLQRQSPILFDTPFGRGEEGIPINGLIWMGNYDEMLQRMQKKIKEGFHCIKLKIGAIQWEEELSLLRKLRKKFPAYILQIRVDANGGFSTKDAPYILDQLSQLQIHSIEQPIAPQQWQHLQQLTHNTPIPIALDEELIGINTLEEKKQMLDYIHPQYLVLKPTLHGGMYGTKEWIDLANKHCIKTWITSALESNIGLNALAHFTAHTYGPKIKFAQGLGTGQLFTDNIPSQLHIIGERLWI